MPFPDLQEIGWSPSQVTSPIGTDEPPDYIARQLGDYDRTKYRWDSNRGALVDLYTGATVSNTDFADPSLGTNVVIPYAYGGGTYNFPEGQNPYIGVPGGAYNAGVAPNSGIFVSSDPSEIAEYGDARRDRDWQGIARVGAVVGGAAALGATPWGQGVNTGSATVSGSNTAAGVAGGGGTTGLTAGQLSGATLMPGVSGSSIGAGLGLGGAGGGIAGLGAGAGAAAGAGGFLGGVSNWLPYAAGGLNTVLGYRAAGDAADAESAANQQAIEEQRRQYDTTRQDLMPWLTAGQGALNRLQDPNAFQASPGYQWARNEGQRDIGNSFAARGGSASGNALRALTEFNTGLANQDYGNWWNQQAGLAGVGQTAGTNLGRFGESSAVNTGNLLAGQGQSRASGIRDRTQSLGGGVNDLALYFSRRRNLGYKY